MDRLSDATEGGPLPGVMVLLEGTFMGTDSDLKGEYSIRSVYAGYRAANADVAVAGGEDIGEAAFGGRGNCCAWRISVVEV